MGRKLRVLIYGVCPYANGGVARHTKRLISYIRQNSTDINLEYYHFGRCYDIANCNKSVSAKNLFTKLCKKKYDVVQMYTLNNWKIQFCIFIASVFTGFSVILSVRNDRFADTYKEMKFYEKGIFRLFCQNVKSYMCVNKDADYLFLEKSKITIIPGYIKPAPEEYTSVPPSEILKFISSNNYTITTNATSPKIYGGLDLYGLDMSIELMANIKKRCSRKTGLLYIISQMNPDYKSHYEAMVRKIIEYDLCDNILMWTAPVSFPAILNRCDLSLRLTSRDGDSSSVREALDLGKSVIASDAAPRPEGTVIFRSRDLADLTEKTIYIMENPNPLIDGVNSKANSNADAIIQLWHSVA